MPERAHLFSLKLGHAFRDACLKQRYTLERFRADVWAGLTVGIIALPLSMALAIATGVPPEHGLYTAIVAGALIALTGGSRLSVSGPTAAFVVVLMPIVASHGLAGLMLVSMLAGVMLIGMAVMRLGRFIEYVPESVTLGFTSGIAIVIATLQLVDLFGLQVEELPEFWAQKVIAIGVAMPTATGAEIAISVATLAVMFAWPKWVKSKIPAHLPAVLVGTTLALALGAYGVEVATIGSRFQYVLADGTMGYGIPSALPHLELPWNRPGPNGEPFVLTWAVARELLPSAFTVAMLCAIESLLCAIVLDRMTKQKHSANSELLGQGLGNLVAAAFGGITATAALARSAVNVRAGGQTPVAAVVHATFVLVATLVLAPWLAYLPMASLAALLLVVAWNMSEARKGAQLVRHAPRADVLVFATCLALTVLFDMVIAIGAGVVLAALLFMLNVSDTVESGDITHGPRVNNRAPTGWKVYQVRGPLCFGAGSRVFASILADSRDAEHLVLYLDGVPLIDATGLDELDEFLSQCEQAGLPVTIADAQRQPRRAIEHAEIPQQHTVRLAPTLAEALTSASELHAGR